MMAVTRRAFGTSSTTTARAQQMIETTVKSNGAHCNTIWNLLRIVSATFPHISPMVSSVAAPESELPLRLLSLYLFSFSTSSSLGHDASSKTDKPSDTEPHRSQSTTMPATEAMAKTPPTKKPDQCEVTPTTTPTMRSPIPKITMAMRQGTTRTAK